MKMPEWLCVYAQTSDVGLLKFTGEHFMHWDPKNAQMIVV